MKEVTIRQIECVFSDNYAQIIVICKPLYTNIMFRAHLIQVKVHVNLMCVNDNRITKMMITNFTSYDTVFGNKCI